jgi:hypothetical protein
MIEPVDVIEKGNMRAEIFYDECADSPRRKYDHVGVMMCIHRRYCLGDEQLNESDFESWDEVKDRIKKEFGAKVILPLYLYDHSGITMNTTGFSCDWDSGQVGFIYAKPDESGDYSTDRIVEILKSEVEEYDMYLKGEVYGYRIFEKKKCPHCNEILDDYDKDECESSYGYIGLEYARESANDELNRCFENERK